MVIDLKHLSNITMKQLFRFWIVAALLFMVGCSKEYDDSALVGRVNDLESRVQRLEQLCQQMNTNISSLQTIVTALQNNDYVTGVTPITENGKTIGYTITFAKAQSITIYHGKDGQNGADGKDGTDGKDSDYVPTIGVKQDADGIYYWTLDGEWLLDDAGNKIKAQGIDGKDGVDGEDGADGENGKDGEDGQNGTNGINGADGKDGITPQLKIEDDYWYVSYDNGASWTQLGKATGEDGKDGTNGTDGTNGSDGKSFFQDVTQDENNVYFTLADGTVITIPKGLALSIEFDESDLVVMSPNSTREIGYTVTSATEAVKVEVTSSADIKAKAVADNANGLTGKIHITTGDAIDEYSKVIVFVSNGDKVIMRSITFEEAGLVVEENATKQATAEGGEMTLEFLSNVECEVVIPEDAQEWISVAPVTRAMEKQTITLKLEPNEGATRSAEVLVKAVDSNLSLTYTIEQSPNADYQLDLEREALIAIYKALDGDNWLYKDNWCSDKPIGEWYGVSVDENNNVVGLIISGDEYKVGERKTFPREVCDLIKLEQLWVDGTNVDSFPSEMSSIGLLSFMSNRNRYITIEDLKPIYDGAKLLESFVVRQNSESYFNIEQSSVSQPIPLELLENINLRELCLECCNLSGTIPEEIGKLNNLTSLVLYNIFETYLTGEIPKTISNLKRLTNIRLFNLNLSGGIPEELYSLVQLENLEIDNCYIGGSLSSNIGNLVNLKSINLRDANLTGELPEEFSYVMDNLWTCMLDGNQLSGIIPDKVKKHPKWKEFWSSIISRNNFDVTIGDIPAPDFEIEDIFGNIVKSSEEYIKNSYTIIYQFDVGMFPYISNAVYSCHDMHSLYNSYHKYGVDVLFFNLSGWDDTAREFIKSNNIPWKTFCFSPYGMSAIPNVTIVDSNSEVVFSTILSYNLMFTDILAFFEDKFSEEKYVSSDYSQDGEVVMLQAATKGNGIDVVLLGDGYSDRQIEEKLYEKDMEYMYNCLFNEEPFKSYQDLFNVYYVNVVSSTEGFLYKDTALDGFFGGDTYVGGNDAACFEYVQKAISAERVDEALIIVAMNSDNYAGTCYMYYPESVAGTYGSGSSISYFPKGGDAEIFAQLLHHEACGHGFAKLADEYAYDYMGTISSDYVSEIQEQQVNWGWWKNVDFTSIPLETRWSHFINDTRYTNEGLGAYEGGLTYWNGVWRPTENSIMNTNAGGFNAPSREAIYYRIHKLAYGDSWEYDYEEFVEWDARNRATAATRAMVYKPANYKPTHPPVIVNKSWKDAK